MKQQKVQALTSAEVSEILALQKWATYSQEYPIRYACTLNGALVQVDSFGIDNLPKLDALVVFGGYPRIVKYAGEIIMKHRRQYRTVDGSRAFSVGCAEICVCHARCSFSGV